MDLSELNPAQRAVVTSAEGPHLVIAGAGTGKTRTLVHRVAWLIQQGVPPKEIVLLTFTRRAAREMLDRCAALVGPAARGVRGGTFHSFAHLALRRHIACLGYTPQFTILDSADAQQLIGILRSELGLAGKQRRFASKVTLHKVISKSINTGQPIPALLEEEYPQYEEDSEDIRRIASLYEQRKKQQNLVDFDDLLVLLLRVLKEEPGARKALSRAARHVLVDEYQDTNRLQAQIAALLSSTHGNLMVVGDEAQSIYGFRGAAVENILQFPAIFPSCQHTTLEENYRSVQSVLDLANGVLTSMQQSYDKRLFSQLGAGDRPVRVQLSDEHEQADFVARQVLALRESGVPLQSQAILFRSGFHANLLEVALTEARIPYRKFGGIRFNEAAHVKDVLALLRLVANPRDTLAWHRVLTWFEGLGDKSALRIEQKLLASEESSPRLQPALYQRYRYHADLVQLSALLEQAERMKQDVPALMARVQRWYKERMPKLYDDWKTRVPDLETLSLLAERYRSLDRFLAEVSLDPIDQSAEPLASDSEDEWLTLSTIHSAKGLEWHTVFLIQLGDGGFPSGYVLDDPERMEEERRLLYVAVTRAQQRLHLVWPRFMRGRYGSAIAPGCSLLEGVAELETLVQEGWYDPESSSEPEEQSAAGGESELERVQRLLALFGD